MYFEWIFCTIVNYKIVIKRKTFHFSYIPIYIIYNASHSFLINYNFLDHFINKLIHKIGVLKYLKTRTSKSFLNHNVGTVVDDRN